MNEETSYGSVSDTYLGVDLALGTVRHDDQHEAIILAVILASNCVGKELPIE